MKTKHSLFLLILLSSSTGLFSQTGIFWFGDTTSKLVNNRIISMKENSSGDLYLLGKASDADYKNVHPYFAVCSKDGKLESQKTVESTNDVYELNNFIVCENNKFRIWGTEVVNGKLTILLNTIDKQGELQETDAMMTMTTTLCGDVCQVNDSTAILAKTLQSSTTQKFHISIYQYNIHNDQQVWYKKLETEDNEEASKIVLMKDGSIILLAKRYDEQLTEYHPLIYKLSPVGDVIWKKEIDGYTTFFQQGISEAKNKSLIYVCSLGGEQDVTGSTKMFVLDSSGNVTDKKEFDDIRANGVLTLKNGNIFVYGSHFQKAGIYIITKACFKIFNPKLGKIKEDEMGIMDGPDAYLPWLAMSAQPTASDFLTAIQLSDGRIACGGRVYLPTETDPNKIIFSDRINKAFLVLMDENGKFRNE